MLMIRNVKHRDIDYADLTAVDHLVRDVLDDQLDLYLARTRMATIVSTGHPYPRWSVTVAWGVMCASVAVFLGGGWLVAADRVGRAAMTIDQLQLVLCAPAAADVLPPGRRRSRRHAVRRRAGRHARSTPTSRWS